MKFKHSFSVACIILLFLLLPGFVYSQNIKIGDISISDSLAKEYFMDCYNRPDTIITQNGYIEGSWYYEQDKRSIGRIIDKFYQECLLVPRTPSAFDFMLFMNRKYKK